MIDMHIHIGLTEKTKHYFTLESYYSFMIENNISKAVVMPNLSNSISFNRLNKDLLLEFTSLKKKIGMKCEDIFKILLLIEPSVRIAEIRKVIMDFPIVGFKFHPSISQITVSDKVLKSYIHLAEEFCFPILVHCGRNYKSHISHLIDTANAYPGVIFIAAHLGGGATHLVEEALALVKTSRLDNIYMDTSAMKLPFLIESAVEEVGESKILWGSDEPYADLRIGKYCCELTHLSDSTKEKVFGGNAMQLFRMYS